MSAPRSRNEILHGVAEDPPEQRELRAGDLDVSLVGPDLRYLRTGEHELVRRIYAAVRDRNWNTVPGRVSELELTSQADAFAVSFSVRHTSEELDFSWRGRIEGSADGHITYELDGHAERDMEYNRAGFCILHPIAEFAGRPYRGLTPDGEVSGVLPQTIGVQGFADGLYVPLFPSVSELETRLDSGRWVRLQFEGDLFEMEDQRNWTDASFKTYCTPLSLGFPHRLAAGEPLRQRVTVSLGEGTEVSPRRPAPGTAPGVELTLRRGAGSGLPALGLGRGEELDERGGELLRALALDHLRVDLDLAGDWQRELAAARTEVEALDARLELALHLRPDQLGNLADLREAIGGARVARVLAVMAGAETATSEETTPGSLTSAVRESLPGLAVYGGTDMNFCELNRTRPQMAAMDGVFYPVVTQVHAYDDLSLVETPAGQAATVHTAHSFAGDLPVAVSPVTLRRRFNPHATGPEAERRADELPDSVDPRQMSLLGAGWTVASLASLFAAGAGSVTYYETMGWRGVIERMNATGRRAFPSRPGEAFPVWHVFAALADRGGAKQLGCKSSEPLAVACLALEAGDSRRALVANLGAASREVSIAGGPMRASALRLNEVTFDAACATPLDHRREAWKEIDAAPLRLDPFETVEVVW